MQPQVGLQLCFSAFALLGRNSPDPSPLKGLFYVLANGSRFGQLYACLLLAHATRVRLLAFPRLAPYFERSRAAFACAAAASGAALATTVCPRASLE